MNPELNNKIHTGIYCIQDLKSQEIAPPFFAIREEQARRIFTSAVAKAPNAPEEYILVRIGSLKLDGYNFELQQDDIIKIHYAKPEETKN